MSKTSYPAQIVYLEDESHCFRHGGLGRWTGRLLNPKQAVDTQSNGPVQGKPFFNITETPSGFDVVMQGGSRHGRRYAWHKTLTEAQTAGIRWAGRRFRIPV